MKRDSEIDYSRQSKVKEINHLKSATILGAGGLGTWVAYLLALSGVPKIKIYARDNVWDSDLARFPFRREQIGQPRYVALRDIILELRPACIVESFPAFYPDSDINPAFEGAVFNCAAGPEGFDEKVYAIAKKNSLPYASGAYHGIYFGIMSNDQPSLEPSQEPVGSWAPVLALTASLMIQSVMISPINFWGSAIDLSNQMNVSKANLETFIKQDKVGR